MFSAFRSSPSNRPSVTEVADQVAQGKMLLIDVREVAEAKASGVADPKHPDCDLPHGLPIAVYCASGGRSGMAVDALIRLGYGPVHNLGGLRDWAAGGGAVVAY